MNVEGRVTCAPTRRAPMIDRVAAKPFRALVLIGIVLVATVPIARADPSPASLVVAQASGPSAQSRSAEARRELEQGLAFEAQGRHAEARDAYGRAIGHDPAFFEAWRKRGWARNRVGDYRGAIGDFDRALALNPPDAMAAMAWNGRGAARHKAGEIDGALADFDRAIKLDPNYASPFANRALVRIDQKDYKGALEDATRASRLDPKMVDAQQTRGLASWLLKDYAVSVEAFSAVLAQNDKSAAAWDGRGTAKLALGDARGALADLERAVELRPTSASFVANRGAAKEGAADLAGARADFERALQMDPANQKAKDGLARIAARSAPPQTVPVAAAPPVSTKLPEVRFSASDPCASANQQTAGTPWQGGGAPVATPTTLPTDDAVILPPPLDFATLSRLQYDGAVTAAQSGMRLVYGAMTAEDEARFEQAWAPLHDAPSPPIVDYLNRLNPLLARFLAGREALLRAAAGYSGALLDASLAVAAQHRTAWDDTMVAARRQAQVMNALQGGLAALAAQISALGNPPNPLDAKCRARNRHREALAQAAPAQSAAPTGDVFASNQISVLAAGGWTIFAPAAGQVPAAGIPLVWDGRAFYAEVRSLSPTSPYAAGEVVPPQGRIVTWIRGVMSPDGKSIERIEASFDGRPQSIYVSTTTLANVPFTGRIPGAIPDLAYSLRYPSGWGRAEGRLRSGDLTRDYDLPGTPAERSYISVYFRQDPKLPAARRDRLPTDPREAAAATDQAAKAANAERLALEADLKETIGFHRANIVFLERNLVREQEDLARETDERRRRELAWRVIQIQSDIQAEHDLIASVQTGTIVHTRSAFDDFAHEKFIQGVRVSAERVDATRRIAEGIDRQIALLPPGERAAMREKARGILDAKSIASGDVERARRLAEALDDQVQGYWSGQGAQAEERAIAAQEHEFYAQLGVMVAGMGVVGTGTAALAQTFGETAALTVWGPHLIGGIYGGVTGTVAGGPREGLKEAVAGSSMLGSMATQFLDGYTAAGGKPGATPSEKAWEGAKAAGAGFFLGQAINFGARLVGAGASTLLGSDSALFKPLVGRAAVNVPVEAARTQQQIGDARTLLAQFQQKETQLARLRAGASAGGPEAQALEAELQALSASMNSSYHAKWLMKYEAHPLVRAKFNTRVEASYSKMMPEMMDNLRRLKYDLNGIEFKPVRNASSAGSSSMDLDLALKERPGMVFVKDGRRVSLHEFMTDAQGAMNAAYHKVTGFSASRSELNLTTSLHPESFTDKRLLDRKVDFNTIGAADIANIGGVVQVKAAKIAGDPVLSTITKAQATCRESAKEIENMLLPALRQKLKQAPNAAEAAKIEAALAHWEGVQKTFKQIGTQETDPYEIMRLERSLREQTGGLGIHETVGELSRKFEQIGARVGR